MKSGISDAELDALLPYATERQAEYLASIREHGGQRAAAAALGCAKSTIDAAVASARKRAADAGWAPENGLTVGNPPGYITGTVTVQEAGGKVERSWKRMSPEAKAALEALERLRIHLCERTRPAPLTSAPQRCEHDVQVTYPIFDPHFGMYAWAPETGQNYDLSTAFDRLAAGMDRLVSSAPPAAQAVIVNGGDWFHMDDSTNETPESRNRLDVDGRFEKVFDVGWLALVRCIDRALERHGHVTLYNVPGNHDPHLTPVMGAVIQAHYRNEPRVTVVRSPRLCQYHRFGRTLLGFHHGHKIKPTDLPLQMAADRRDDWSETEFQHWYTGHIHHKSGHELGGVTVESFRTIAAKDAWHASKGYKGGQELTAIVHHFEDGEIQRLTCSLRRMSEAA
jgi:hypothetical protein